MNLGQLFNRLSLKKLMNDHKREIRHYNANHLPTTLLIAFLVNLVPTMISIFRPTMRDAFFAYLGATVASLLLLVLFLQKKMRPYALLGFYTLTLTFYLLVLYLGVLAYQTQPAGTALTYFAIIPLLFIDRPYRSNLVLIGYYALFVVLSYQFKGTYLGSVDLLNAFISLTLGILFGRVFLVSHLHNFEKDRQLIAEKETDILTGLPNRRKLFETLKEIEQSPTCPCGILLIDVDNFKSYNDRHGHGVGDQCLQAFGAFLLSYEARYDLRFFRYGGEEFMAIVGDECKANLKDIAEQIRLDTMKMKMDIETITISIGAVACSNGCFKDHEALIIRADKALYLAKSQGRHCVALWDPSVEEMDLFT